MNGQAQVFTRPGPIYLHPVVRPLSRVSVRRSSCCLISARGAHALRISLLRLGPRHQLSLLACVLQGSALKKNGNGSQRPRTRTGRGRILCWRQRYAAASTMHPNAQHQHASSRVTAMFETRISCQRRQGTFACPPTSGCLCWHAFSPRGGQPAPEPAPWPRAKRGRSAMRTRPASF